MVIFYIHKYIIIDKENNTKNIIDKDKLTLNYKN